MVPDGHILSIARRICDAYPDAVQLIRQLDELARKLMTKILEKFQLPITNDEVLNPLQALPAGALQLHFAAEGSRAPSPASSSLASVRAENLCHGSISSIFFFSLGRD
jgi:hypothetical protein